MENYKDKELSDQVIKISRVSKVVTGGRRFSFSALVVVGDQKGTIGFGTGKSKEVPDAIRKGLENAKKKLVKIPIKDGTIPYMVEGHAGAGRVMLKPASRGTGIIAGGAVRAIMEVSGITDILTKSIGTDNKHNVVRATFEGFERISNWDAICNIRKKEADGRQK